MGVPVGMPVSVVAVVAVRVEVHHANSSRRMPRRTAITRAPLARMYILVLPTTIRNGPCETRLTYLAATAYHDTEIGHGIGIGEFRGRYSQASRLAQR